jgi:hypothetical protein
MLIIVVTLLAYIPAIRGGFIWDDPEHVTHNPTLRDLPGLVRIWTDLHSLPQWYPLVHTTFWIEHHLWGANPLGYHLVNVLLHIGVAMLLWRVLVVLEVPGAWLAAAIFALHPVHVESVAWITERKNVLSGVFYFAAMLTYLAFLRVDKRGAEEQTGSGGKGLSRWGLALGLFICALLSKTVTATLPAAILVIVWWKRGSIRWRDVAPLVPFFVLGIGMGLLTAHLEVERVGATAQRIGEFDLTMAQRLIIAGSAVWFYLWKLVAPIPLIFVYPKWEIDPRTWFLWIAPVGLAVVIGALALNRKRIGRGPLAAMLLFVGTLFPALGFVNVYPMRFSYVADHFQYLASASIIALAASLLGRLVPPMRSAVGAMVLVALGVLTFNQCHNYRDAETLWRATLDRNRNSWMVRVNLGDVLFNRAQQTRDPRTMAEAREHYLRAVELAPDLWETNFPAGLALVEGSPDDQQRAMQYFRRTVELNPDFVRGWYSIGQLHQLRGHREEAIAAYEKTLDLERGFEPARQRLDALLKTPSTRAVN